MAKVSPNDRYSGKIIKAGTLLPDTKLILGKWDENLDAQSNLDRVREVHAFRDLFGALLAGKVRVRVEILFTLYVTSPISRAPL